MLVCQFSFHDILESMPRKERVSAQSNFGKLRNNHLLYFVKDFHEILSLLQPTWIPLKRDLTKLLQWKYMGQLRFNLTQYLIPCNSLKKHNQILVCLWIDILWPDSHMSDKCTTQMGNWMGKSNRVICCKLQFSWKYSPINKYRH